MKSLIEELPDNAYPDEYEKRTEDLPDVITIEDIIAYNYKFETSKSQEIVNLLENWK